MSPSADFPDIPSQMRIFAFVNDAGTVSAIRDHIGESTRQPRIAAAHGPPLRDAEAAAEQARNDPSRDSSAHLTLEITFDQRIAC